MATEKRGPLPITGPWADHSPGELIPADPTYLRPPPPQRPLTLVVGAIVKTPPPPPAETFGEWLAAWAQDVGRGLALGLILTPPAVCLGLGIGVGLDYLGLLSGLGEGLERAWDSVLGWLP